MMLDSIRNRLFGSYGPLGWTFKRYQYKRVWNALANSELAAKVVVAGHHDEALFTATGQESLESLRRTVGVHADDVILEIGAGVGRVGAALAPFCREWIGTDVSENMVRYIRKRLAHLPNVRALATSGHDLVGIPSQSIDLVYSTVVFMHLSQWDRYLYVRDAYRVLKPGGRIYIDGADIAGDTGWKFFESHLALAPKDRPPNISELSTASELSTYLARAGFRDLHTDSDGMFVAAWGHK